MKKLLLALLLIGGAASASFAQAATNGQHALGLRIGGGNNFGAEFSYQHALSSSNRIQADLGIRSGSKHSSWLLNGVYQWVWNIESGFNWYAGVGGGIGAYQHKYDDYNRSKMILGLSGTVGIEYNFDFPLQIAIDTRPMINLINPNSNLAIFDLAISLRYKF